MTDEDFPLEAYSCEDICKSCKFFEYFGEYCPCALNISCIGYNDKAIHIVVACDCYEKNFKKGLTDSLKSDKM